MPLSKILLSAAALSAGCLALLMTSGILRAEDQPAPATKASVDAPALARQLLEDTRPAKTSARPACRSHRNLRQPTVGKTSRLATISTVWSKASGVCPECV